MKQALNKIVVIWLWGDWLCKSMWFVYYTSLMVSSFTMTAMAIERLVAMDYEWFHLTR